MLSKPVAKVKELIGKLFSLKDSPHAIAGGVAIGMFMGFTPLFGLKTVLSLGAAWALRCSPVAALIAVSLHDVITPLWPVLLLAEYNIGTHLLGMTPEVERHVSGHHTHWSALVKWSTYTNFDWAQFKALTLPTLLGSLPFSIGSAILAYFVTLGLVRRRQARLAAETAGPSI